jgi:hypothetical protein
MWKKLDDVATTIVAPPTTLALDSTLLHEVILPPSIELVVIFKNDLDIKSNCDFIIVLPSLVQYGDQVSFHNLSNEEVKIASPNGVIDGRQSVRFIEINGIRTYGLVENVGWVTFGKS